MKRKLLALAILSLLVLPQCCCCVVPLGLNGGALPPVPGAQRLHAVLPAASPDRAVSRLYP